MTSDYCFCASSQEQKIYGARSIAKMLYFEKPFQETSVKTKQMESERCRRARWLKGGKQDPQADGAEEKCWLLEAWTQNDKLCLNPAADWSVDERQVLRWTGGSRRPRPLETPGPRVDFAWEGALVSDLVLFSWWKHSTFLSSMQHCNHWSVKCCLIKLIFFTKIV